MSDPIQVFVIVLFSLKKKMRLSSNEFRCSVMVRFVLSELYERSKNFHNHQHQMKILAVDALQD